uniref:DUF2975 domain-containing protein n=1 Tax=Acrobeloides nanus TaxID=290746 RepID=A0A914E8H8_9BILA
MSLRPLKILLPFSIAKMSTLDNAKREVEKIANELRDSAEKTRQQVQSSFTSNQGYQYANVIHQLRTGQLVVTLLQVIILYMESDRLWLASFLIPFFLIGVNIFLTGKRWYHQIDGRYDVQQMLSARESGLKVQYGLAVFGGFLLALAVHFVAPIMPSGLSSLLFNLSDYLAIVTSGATAGVEVYEGLKSKRS